MFASWVGPRGSGKTLSMVHDAIAHMINGLKVWSNSRISINTDFGTPGKFKYYETIPLEMNQVYSMDQDLSGGWVYIDEVPLWFDNRRSGTVGNRLINSLLAIMRHRRLSFGVTSQQFQWLDKRMQFQCDTLIECSDLHFKFPHLPKGVMIGQTYKDLSGVSTGTPYHISGHTEAKQLYAKPFWSCYDSWQEFDYMTAQKRVRIAAGTSVLRQGESGAYIDDSAVQNEAIIEQTVQFVRSAGLFEIKSTELEGMLQDAGFKGTLRQAGRTLKKQGLIYRPGRDPKYSILHQGVDK